MEPTYTGELPAGTIASARVLVDSLINEVGSVDLENADLTDTLEGIDARLRQIRKNL